MGKSFLEAARERAKQPSAVLAPGQSNLQTGMATTANTAAQQDSGQGNAGETPTIVRNPLSPTTPAPVDNERGGVPMAEDPDRARDSADATKTDEAILAEVAAAIQPAYEPYQPVEGDYKALRLNQFFKSTALRVAPNADGWYHPKDEEEASLLAYYATKHGLVEAFTK